MLVSYIHTYIYTYLSIYIYIYTSLCVVISVSMKKRLDGTMGAPGSSERVLERLLRRAAEPHES